MLKFQHSLLTEAQTWPRLIFPKVGGTFLLTHNKPPLNLCSKKKREREREVRITMPPSATISIQAALWLPGVAANFPASHRLKEFTLGTGKRLPYTNTVGKNALATAATNVSMIHSNIPFHCYHALLTVSHNAEIAICMPVVSACLQDTFKGAM